MSSVPVGSPPFRPADIAPVQGYVGSRRNRYSIEYPERKRLREPTLKRIKEVCTEKIGFLGMKQPRSARELAPSITHQPGP